jgi:hypothetical protein
VHRTDRVLVDGAEYFDQEMNRPYRREQRKALLEILRSRNFGGGSPVEGVIRINPGPRHSSTPFNFSSRATPFASGAEGDSRRAVEVAIVALREADPAAYLRIQEVFNVDVPRERLLTSWSRLAEAGLSKDEILAELANEYGVSIRVIKKILGRSRVYQD